MTRHTLLLIDGSALIYRSVLSPGKPLTSSSGEPTRGTFLFLKTLMRVLDAVRPTHVLVALDAPRATTWRRKKFPDYKANRDTEDEIPEHVTIQVSRIKQLIKHLGLYSVLVDGYEADDVIGTVAFDYNDDMDIVVASGDKDFHQLLCRGIRMINPWTLDWTSGEDVVRTWGVSVSQVVYVKALAGDSSDNIPGVKGIGMKRAVDLIKTYKHVDGVRKAAKKGELTPTQNKNVLATDLDLMLELSTICDLVMLPPELDTAKPMKFKGLDFNKAAPLITKLGFNSILRS